MRELRTGVLVVDDSPDFLDVVRRVLEASRPSFEVYTVENGSDAIAFLVGCAHCHGTVRPSFVLLDFHLPDMKAPAVLERWRRAGLLDGMPVLVLSQADWTGDETRVLAAGAGGFRVKPSQPQALRELVIDFWRTHVETGDTPPAA